MSAECQFLGGTVVKKKLIALALSAIAAGGASAQTANVTLFGVVDTYLASVRANNGGRSVTQIDAGGLSGSRWGLRGSEALGNGLNVAFTLENGFLSDSGALGQGGRLFGRQAHVGLNGGFGSVTVGRQYTPAFYATYSGDVDEYSNFSIVANQLVLVAGGLLRADNAITYSTPNMGGFTMSAQWAFGEVAGNTSANRIFGANAQYSNGPINAGIGYADNKNASGVSSQRTSVLAASYNFGIAKVGGEYHEIKNLVPTANKWKGWTLGVVAPMGAISLVAEIGQSKNGALKHSEFELGANYSLSKRTDLYVRYLNGNNNASSTFDIAGVGGAVGSGASGALVAGQDKSAIGLGIRHRF
jgi:predicted porin